MMARALIMFALSLLLASCGGERFSDLRQFVKDSDNIPHGRIPPLPEVANYEPFAYSAEDVTDPFRPRKIAPTKGAGNGLEPDFNRRKEPLETYPLENLRMVGTLQQKQQTFALVRAPDNNLFRVRSGNYLGQNFGRIEDISEGAIKLKEIVQDGSGDWTERVSTLQLVDDAAPGK